MAATTLTRPARGTAPRLLDRVAERLRSDAIILMYHRIADPDVDPWQLAVSPRNFGDQLEMLTRRYRPVPLRRIVRSGRLARAPRRAVVLTFDDGYADNLYSAKPLLERHGVPATAFIASGLIGGAREFWWDELERLVFAPARLPDRLHISIGATTLDRPLATAHEGRASPDAQARHQLYVELWRQLLPLAHDVRTETLDRLAAWSGAGRQPRTDRRPLTRDEVVELARGDLITVGAHTVTHPRLSAHNAAAQREEIERSRRDLADLTGRTITDFAYPHGDRGPETKSIVRAAGFESACGAHAGPVRRNSDPFHLPRLAVENVPGDALAELLYRWLHA